MNIDKIKRKSILFSVMLGAVLFVVGYLPVHAEEAESAKNQTDKTEVVLEGVFVEDVDISGMTKEEAKQAIDAYVAEVQKNDITLIVESHTFAAKAQDLGFRSDDAAVLEKALSIGEKGNVIKRYKELTDLKHEPKVLELAFTVDDTVLKEYLGTKCSKYDKKAKNMGLVRENGAFTVVEGTAGHELNVDKSAEIVKQYLLEEWNLKSGEVALVAEDVEPRGSKEELSKVKDVLGTYTTNFKSSGASRTGNIKRGAELINGTILYPGEEFSTYNVVSPISLENGYFMAASYLQGKVVESPGGGICQVSTTLYNAVLRAELEVTERSNHSMIVNYVDPSADAAIAGTYKDLKFKNNLDSPIYIEGIISGKNITFNIYGAETRASTRTVDYVSETVSETEPTTVLTGNESLNIGVVSTTQSAHKGYVAKLWKVVYENGKEVSREEVNKSKYSMAPKYITVGTATTSEEASAAIQAAIASGDENQVRSVAAQYANTAPSQASPEPEQPAAENPDQATAEEAQAAGSTEVTQSADTQSSQPADGAQTDTTQNTQTEQTAAQ